MCNTLLAAGFKVVERMTTPSTTLQRKQTTKNTSCHGTNFPLANGKELSVDTKSFQEGSELDFIPTNLVAADYFCATGFRNALDHQPQRHKLRRG
jgi:hypothetical protein